MASSLAPVRLERRISFSSISGVASDPRVPYGREKEKEGVARKIRVRCSNGGILFESLHVVTSAFLGEPPPGGIQSVAVKKVAG